jgi:hypothetical protein
MAFIFVVPPQARETYLSIVGGKEWLHGLLGALCMLILSASLFAWNAWLAGRRIDRLFTERPVFAVDRWLKEVRDLKAVLSAALTLFGITYGLLATIPGLKSAAAGIKPVDATLGSQLDALPNSFLILGLVCGGVCAGWLFLLAHFCRGRGILRILTATWIIAVAVYAAPSMPTEQLVEVARWLGPVAVTALIGITLVPTVSVVLLLIKGVIFEGLLVPLVSSMTRLIGARRLAILTGLMIAALVVIGTGQEDSSDANSKQTVKTTEQSQIAQIFAEWLRKRQIEPGQPPALEQGSPARPYPVIIVAAQGGGIYAAAAAMVLMTRLQEDTKGRFAEHVFAISAVSGGAIGASVFRALVAHQTQTSSDSLLPTIKTMATDDYISPLLLATPLDWATKVPALVFHGAAALLQRAVDWLMGLNKLGGSGGDPPTAGKLAKIIDFLSSWQTVRRAEALKVSFLKSYGKHFPQHGLDGLSVSLAQYWSEKFPALVLGATSAETGVRVAFSPFSLAGIGNGTLFAFCDLVGKLELTKNSKDEYQRLSVIDAAVTSARFPGILPAWAMEHERTPENFVGSGCGNDAKTTTAADEAGRMNFVDGGYADNSGATTAADLLIELKKHVERNGLEDRVAFRLVLLTDSETDVDILRVKGTNLPDVIAPVMALLNSRQLLASTAITRARNQIAERFSPDAITAITLDPRLFPLPLGWLLSQQTHGIVSSMLGSAKQCALIGTGQISDVQKLVRANSCAQKDIVDVLK